MTNYPWRSFKTLEKEGSNNVSLFLKYLSLFKGYVHECNKDSSVGCISQYLAAWESLTSDQKVLQKVKEFELEFDKILASPWYDNDIPIYDLATVKTEVKKLLEKGVIVACDHDEFISLIFLLDKTDHSKNIIWKL